MDGQVKTTSKSTGQDEQQHQIKAPVEDEVFGQGEMVDSLSDPLEMRDSKTKDRSFSDSPKVVDAQIWADGQEPESEADHIEPKKKPADRAVAIGEKLGLHSIRSGLLEDDPHALDRTNDEIVALVEGGLVGDQPNLLARLSKSLQATRKTAKKGKSKADASPVELYELRDTALATLDLHRAMEEANLEVAGQLEFQKLSDEEQGATEEDLKNVNELSVPAGDARELMDEENLMIVPVVEEVDFYEADQEPEYEIVKIRDVDDLSRD